MSDDDENSDDGSFHSDMDSDRELQVAFESGLLKPGINYVAPTSRRPPINNESGLRASLNAFRKQHLDWIERLDVSVKRETNDETAESSTGPAEESDDFKRECSFYTQAQQSAAIALERLNAAGVPTQRPDDYFAEMVKSDQHMQKVRAKLITSKAVKERRDSAKQLREQKKFAGHIQKNVQKQQQNDKRELMQAVKKHRRGMKTQLEEMLGEGHAQMAEQRERREQGRAGGRKAWQPFVSKKRDVKNQKFGFGGRKKGMRHNTRESASDVAHFSSQTGVKLNKKGRPLKGRPPAHKMKAGGKKKRPGKSARKSKK